MGDVESERSVFATLFEYCIIQINIQIDVVKKLVSAINYNPIVILKYH